MTDNKTSVVSAYREAFQPLLAKHLSGYGFDLVSIDIKQFPRGPGMSIVAAEPGEGAEARTHSVAWRPNPAVACDAPEPASGMIAEAFASWFKGHPRMTKNG